MSNYFKSWEEFWTIFMCRFLYKVLQCSAITRCQHCHVDNFKLL